MTGARPETDGERAADPKALGARFDADYYEHHLGEPYRWEEPKWHEFFGRVADALVAELAPTTALDAGCGIGFLVHALRSRGVEAYGFDVSEYAIAQVPEELRAYCWVASITEELERDYDLITCIEVLEHLPAELSEPAIDNLARHTSRILFSSTPGDYREATHVNVQPMEHWIALFARGGFFRNVDFDATVVAPHAVLLERGGQTPVAVARDYERWHWRHRAELIELRNASGNRGQIDALQRRAESLEASAARSMELEAELERLREEGAQGGAEAALWGAWSETTGFRIFMRLAALRLELAPRGTVRDRLATGALRRIARLVRAARAPSWIASEQGMRAVLFYSGCPGDAKRYRCDHQAAELAVVGGTSDVAQEPELDLNEVIDRYAAFVLHRVAWSPALERFVLRAKALGKPVVFDTDDLVFDPDAAVHVAALTEMDEMDRSLFVHGLRRYRRTLRASDGVLVSTDPLREAAEGLHDNVEVAYNAVSDEMVRLSDAAARLRERGADARRRVTIAYFSGTPTHNRDFLEAADAVLWALENYPETRFLAVGHLSLDHRFDVFGARVEQVRLQPWQRLPELLARTDINLAPLEPGNPFTEAKSCLKYVEAGLVGTPTIASPRADFARAIEHGRNGLLADTPEEWRDALQELIESPERRSRIGDSAYEDVRRNHTVRARGRHFQQALGSLVGQDERPLTVNWVLRAPIAQRGGGYRTIFRLANHLGRQGHHVRVYVEPISHLARMSEADIVAFVERHFGPLEVEVHVGHDAIGPADATIATNWPTAPTVADHPASLFKLYLIQDYEPDFYEPEDVEALRAEQTYALPLRHVCYGPHLARVIEEHSGKPGDALDFALEPAFRMLVPPEERPGPPKVLFFARPDQRRRGYDLGLEALRLVKEAEPETEILFFGATDEELGRVPVPIQNLGVLDEEALARALNKTHVFLSFSFTNISHAPLEGMACGAAVVEVDVPWVRGMVEDGSNCLLAAPESEAVAASVLRLVREPELRHRLGRNGADAMVGASWERTGDQLERLLRETCFVRLEPLVPQGAAEAE